MNTNRNPNPNHHSDPINTNTNLNQQACTEDSNGHTPEHSVALLLSPGTSDCVSKSGRLEILLAFVSTSYSKLAVVCDFDDRLLQ